MTKFQGTASNADVDMDPKKLIYFCGECTTVHPLGKILDQCLQR